MGGVPGHRDAGYVDVGQADGRPRGTARRREGVENPGGVMSGHRPAPAGARPKAGGHVERQAGAEGRCAGSIP